MAKTIWRAVAHRSDDLDYGEYRQCQNNDCGRVFYAEWDDDGISNKECPYCHNPNEDSKLLAYEENPEIERLIALQDY